MTFEPRPIGHTFGTKKEAAEPSRVILIPYPHRSADGINQMTAMIEARACQNSSSFSTQQASSSLLESIRYSINAPNPQVSAPGALTTNDMHCELLNFTKGDAAEMEFSLASHLIILLPDGMSSGWEWRNGERSGKSSSMLPNAIIFNPARDYLWLRKRTSQASCRLLLVTIAPKVMNRLSANDVDTAGVRLHQQIGVDDENVRRTLVTLLHEIENPGWNNKFYIETLLTLLLSQLVRCASNLTTPRRIPYRKGGLPSWRLKRALELIEGDLCQSPSLVELARHLRLHPASLCRAFKQSTGLSPHQYLLSHRINCARVMMRDPFLTLTQIALDCGFSNSSQFSVTFKRIVGISPRGYRRSL
jgi:AraC family transcriptional regulator